MRRLALALLTFTLIALGLNKAAPPVRAAAAVPQAVVVTNQYGAALRTQPSSDATIVDTAACGETLAIAGSQGGWFRVYSRASACVDSDTPFQLENGPIEAAGENWFQVSSPMFGRGWMLAEFLVGTPLA